MPRPTASTSGPFSAAEVLDVIDESSPPQVLRIVVLAAIVAGAVGIGASLLVDRNDDTALAATPAALP